jgi:mannose-6-phosphate isomerase-like protein (cupin superfamily)
MQKIRLADKLAAIDEYWRPKIIGELNGQHVKLVKFQGEFVWHRHDHEDELFLVLHGAFEMQFRNEAGVEETQMISEGELAIVPKGTEHRPRAESEVHVLLFEPAGTLNTGNIRNSRTILNPEQI